MDWLDEPLEYARLVLNGEMQDWVDSVDNLEFSLEPLLILNKIWVVICKYEWYNVSTESTHDRVAASRVYENRRAGNTKRT